jgi:hypothetical protein
MGNPFEAFKTKNPEEIKKDLIDAMNASQEQEIDVKEEGKKEEEPTKESGEANKVEEENNEKEKVKENIQELSKQFLEREQWTITQRIADFYKGALPKNLAEAIILSTSTVLSPIFLQKTMEVGMQALQQGSLALQFESAAYAVLASCCIYPIYGKIEQMIERYNSKVDAYNKKNAQPFQNENGK